MKFARRNFLNAALPVLSVSSFLAPCHAQPNAKLPVPKARVCGAAMPGPPALPWQIAEEWERIGGPSSPIGCPTSSFIADIPNGGYVQFDHGQIAISQNVWEKGVVAAYQDDWGRIIADWNVSWVDPSHYNYTKFLVRWDFNGQHFDSGNPCERGDGDQCDVLADMTEVQVFLLHYYNDTHLRTKGTFPVPSNHGNGVYRILVEGCDEGTIGGSTCKQGWMHPVVVDYQQPATGAFPMDTFPVDFRSVPSIEPNSQQNVQSILFQRAAAIVLYSACTLLPWKAYRNEQDYANIILAKLAYADFYDEDLCPGRITANRTEAFASLLQQSVESATGTTRDSCPACRTGEYDVALGGYVPMLLKFGSILPQNVSDHILNDLLNKRGPIDPNDFVVDLVSPETENHLNLIESARYLTNDVLFAKTGDPQFDNDANGLAGFWLNRLRNILLTDFLEYNARPYQSYSMIAIENLFSHAHNPDVRTAAGMVLDYVSAKMAMSSNQARRVVPYRRKASYNDPFLLGWHADAQSARAIALAGNLDILTEAKSGTYWAPKYGGGDMLRAVLSSYRIPDLLTDLLINPSHRLFFQGLHHYADELYASSPSFLISAGGHYADPAYPVFGIGQPDDIGLAVSTTIMPTGRFINRDYLVRFEGDSNDKDRFNMCVAPGFACGLNPVIPPILTSDPFCVDGSHTNWTFINFSGWCNFNTTFGAYLAVFKNNGMGFAEVFDTKVNPNLPFSTFVQHVLQQNQNTTFNASGLNTYITITGEIIQFTSSIAVGNQVLPISQIVSITNGPPVPNGESAPMAFGDIVSSQPGSGVITITNPYTGQVHTLDYHDLSVHPVVTDSNIPPFTQFTCLPGFVWRSANANDPVCVTPAIKAAVLLQNSLGPSRSNGNGCLPGFVFRGANWMDHVCVTPADQAEASFDNLLAPSRRAIP